MIEIAGSAASSFIFPAGRAIAYDFYSNLARLLSYLPHIELVDQVGKNQIRALYNTLELGSYRVHIFCDLDAELDDEQRVLRVYPSRRRPRIKVGAGLTSTTARGRFGIESHFHDMGHYTRIEYNLMLSACLPTPHGLRLVPDRVLDRIADGITTWRIREIANGFVENSIAAYPQWARSLAAASANPWIARASVPH